jgi:formylglycine-generating enzyme required for sulfatase activity/tRNA A-37 threonylcarbamoyl transferase component Bud32
VSDQFHRLTAALADRYAITEELGAGGMATVYLAEDLKHRRQVAVKVLRPELASILGAERFLQEIEVTANLQHPHVVPLFDSGEADNFLYYVMPFVEGESLRDRMNREPRLSIDEALDITRDIAAALGHAHEYGVVHRDIKPENVLLVDGEALVADFGIALAVASATPERLTATGLSIGTPAFMSPEQIGGEAAIDGRSDIYSLACVLYEMLAGVPAFAGPTVQAIVAKALADPPPEVRRERPDVPEVIEAAIVKAMAKSPEERFETARAFADSLHVGQAPVVSAGSGRMRATAAVAALALGTVAFLWWQSSQVAQARDLLPRIAVLAEAGEYGEAYELVQSVEEHLADDSTLARLLYHTADFLTVTTEPSGAQVAIQPFTDDIQSSADPQVIGETPITRFRIPRVDHLVVITRDGFDTVERIASTTLSRPSAGRRGTAFAPGRATGVLPTQVEAALLDAPEIVVDVALIPEDRDRSDMVFVPGGPYELVSPDAPLGLSTTLADFFLDRFEVSNEAFREFVLQGGYSDPAFWTETPEAARDSLVDRTGLPGPRGWSSQAMPAGSERHPVTGVTWYEAAAYCASVGKRLPTIFEWEKAVRKGRSAARGILMPWGLMASAGAAASRANFNSSGTAPIDAFPFGIGPYGAYAAAGNAKEWLANRMGTGYTVTGGSWEDPAYLYTEYGSQSPTLASAALGFRCAAFADQSDGDQGAQPIEMDERTPVYTPVDRPTFESLLAHYRYDPQPANPRLDNTTETDGWVRERIWIDGVEGDSVLLYFYVPQRGVPPYQTIVHVPGSGVLCCETLHEETEWAIGPVIQAGRAVLAPVLKGMVERSWGPDYTRPETQSVRFRDEMVRHATELRLGMDYLEERDDVDMDKLAYISVSWGGGSRLGFAVVDDRYKAVVFIGGGIDERVKPTLPEADNVNFAPYIGVPTMLLNGSNDEEHPWFSRALPLWNLLSEPKELVLVEGGAHVPSVEDRIPPINDFLDRHLGRVTTR